MLVISCLTQILSAGWQTCGLWISRERGINLPSAWSGNSLSAESTDVYSFQKSRAGQLVSGALLVTVSLHISVWCRKNYWNISSLYREKSWKTNIAFVLQILPFFIKMLVTDLWMSGFSGRLFIMQMLQVVVHYAAVTRQNTILWSPPLNGEQKSCLRAKVHIIGMAVLRSVLAMQENHKWVLFVL